jgi:23S rRNA (uracil1939-C5)-methyltransferase
LIYRHYCVMHHAVYEALVGPSTFSEAQPRGRIMQEGDQTAPAPTGPNRSCELTVDKIVTGGVGLAREEAGRAVFVPLTAPGDRIRATIETEKRRYATARLDEVLEAGPQRREAPCPHFGACGGCDLQHLDVAAQRAAKMEIVSDCFRRLGQLEVAEILEGPDADQPEYGYRTKLRLFAAPTGHYGLMRRGTHEVVPISTCRLLPEIFDRDILPWLRMLPPVEQMVLRLDGRGHWLLCLYGPANRLQTLRKILADEPGGKPPVRGCTGLLFNNFPAWGRTYLVIHCAGKKYRVGAQSFFQSNLGVADRCVEIARAWLADAPAPRERLLDLYCGVGLFSLALADDFASVVAADSDPQAVADAANNVQRDRTARDRVQVVTRTADDVLRDRELVPPDLGPQSCCVVDPPRAGLGKDTCTALAAAGPAALLYLSCDPATLARDARALTDAGYELRRAKVLDMFPQTGHVETLVLLTRS